MTLEEQTIHFSDDVDNLVRRYREEYDCTYAVIVGVLQMKSHLLCAEAEARGKDQ